MNSTDGAGCVVTDPKRRGEKTNSHRQNDDHCVVDLMHADLARNGEKARAEEYDGGNAFERAQG